MVGRYESVMVSSITQTEIFIKELLGKGNINRKAQKRLYEGYKTVLRARNMLHLPGLFNQRHFSLV